MSATREQEPEAVGRAPEREARGLADRSRQTPPSGEEIHLPGPTILPFMTAIGITLIVIGTTITFIFSIVGAVIFIVATVKWIRSTRRAVAALPDEHHQ